MLTAQVCTRFAPSPTGRLHLGHVLAAQVAYQLANDSGGTFLLRHEDLDGPRVRESYYQEIEADLTWLGLPWQGTPLRQTDRTHAYQAALLTLRQKNLTYPCFCTRREIQDEWSRSAVAPQLGTEDLIYPGTCRHLSAADRTAKLLAGQPHAWRIDSAAAAVQTGPLTFQDLRFGEISVDPQLLGDVVLARKDIGIAYHLAVVVDDAYQKVSHVTRGEDLLASTHVHRLLQVLLDLPQPIYLHHPLVCDENGKRLAKRHDAQSIASLRESGLSPAQVLALLP